MSIVKDLYTEWSKHHVPTDACQVQKQETERAFYAGCFSLLMGLQRMNHINMEEDKQVELLTAIDNELRDYFILLTTIPKSGSIESQ